MSKFLDITSNFYQRTRTSLVIAIFMLPGSGVALGGSAGHPRFFDVLGVRPIHGRSFEEGDAVPAESRAGILAHDPWRIRFGSDPTVVGRLLEVDGLPVRLVGVAPAGPTPSRRSVSRLVGATT